MAKSPDPASSAAPEDGRAEPPGERTDSPEEAFASLRGRFDEFVDYAVYYLICQLDALKFAIKRRILTASIMAVTVLAAAGAIVTAVVLLCEGICDALSGLLGHRWAGELVTSLLLLGLVALAGSIAVNRLFIGPHQKIIDRYEELRRRQRQRHGRDVRDRAREDKTHG
jgi:hypothetical protein